MELERAKGTKDVFPEEKIAEEEIVDTLKNVFKTYGFPPLETPILERFETLSAKYAGGSEIMKEVFKLTDQGGRELGLRYDLTVPLARVIATNPQLKMPFKRYQIGRAFRDGPIKLGRYREFWQCDVDTVGTKSVMADAELLGLAQEFFKRIKLPVVILVNNRKILDGLLESLGVSDSLRPDVIISIDKLEKISRVEIEKELLQKGLLESDIKGIFRILDIKGSNEKKISELKKVVKSSKGLEGLKEIEDILSYVKDETIVFSVSLARGLTYYTGMVFEVFSKNKNFKSAVAAGGRWDDMIGKFIGNKEVPAVGISFGISAIMDALKLEKRLKDVKTTTKVFVIPINTFKESFQVVKTLRSKNINTDIDLMNRGVSKNLDYADKLRIPFVIFVGEKELKKKKIKLKDMKTGKEKLASLNDAIKLLKKQ